MTYTYQELITEFEEAAAAAEEFLSPIAEETFVKRPSPDRWSVAECYHHLVRFNDEYNRSMREAAFGEDAYRPRNEHKTAFRPRMVARWAIRFFEPPYKMKVKTLKPFVPDSAEGLSRESVLAEFQERQELFIGQLRELLKEQVDLDAVYTAHPVFPVLKMRLVECYAIILAHQRRHFWQAGQVLKVIKSEVRRS